MQTIQQQRSAFCLEAVNAMRGQACEAEFASHAKALPFMIRHNGLGQAAAFCKAKEANEPSYGKLYDVLSGWLTRERQPLGGTRDLLEGIAACDMTTYMACEAEALALLDWLRKLSAALLAGETREGE